MDKYYYLGPEGRQMGPYSFSELRSRITPETIVWREGMDDWAPASTVPELDELFRSSTPPHASAFTPPPVKKPDNCLFGASRFAMVQGRTRTRHQFRQKGEKFHNSRRHMRRCRFNYLFHPIGDCRRDFCCVWNIGTWLLAAKRDMRNCASLFGWQ